ncbi:Core-2/I-branching beta-1,6-N-acetylglucosaminyltransferase family protein [Striga asiatica]|uniref:Core-2/I-branching beta-1,6-N-acetylglucosaminyltransferase family protein n=1 Tax=Striga asiatica TaxID=4170 RepID=A0A5A7R1U8_STRAF|nr:Core-2/I-branching beta-1,6-N-acetylglucosaminyltransferase family protein [Striga asiatica]
MPPLTSLYLVCALLLSLHLAAILTLTRNSTTSAATSAPTTANTTTATIISDPILLPPSKPLTRPTIKNRTTGPLPPATQFPAEGDGDDAALLRLASRADSISDPKPGWKLAFMFLTTGPLPFAPLWELYFARAPKSAYNIYVHADPGGNYSTPFSGVFSGRVVPSKPTRRRTPTLAAAARRLLAHALLHDGANSMFVLLSPSCVPLHSFRFTRRVLRKSGRSFVEILDEEPGAYERWAARGEETMLPEVEFEDFRIGSQFWALTRNHARVVVGDTRLWPKFRRPCLDDNIYICYTEEHYFPTLLSMVDPRGCVPCTLTHVDWSYNYHGHPRTYNASEVGRELILGLRRMRPRYGDEEFEGPDPSSVSVSAVEEDGPGFRPGDRKSDRLDSPARVRRRRRKRPHPFLFARKFSPESLDPLMSIADDVIFRD